LCSVKDRCDRILNILEYNNIKIDMGRKKKAGKQVDSIYPDVIKAKMPLTDFASDRSPSSLSKKDQEVILWLVEIQKQLAQCTEPDDIRFLRNEEKDLKLQLYGKRFTCCRFVDEFARRRGLEGLLILDEDAKTGEPVFEDDVFLCTSVSFLESVEEMLEGGNKNPGEVSRKVEEYLSLSLGETELALASEQGDVERVKALILQGADVNKKNSSGETALIRATDKGHADIVGFLLDNGADPDSTTDSGRTALMYAAGEGLVNLMSLLLERGADPDHRDSTGMTPLMNAVKSGSLEAVEFLIQNNTNKEAYNMEGKDALTLAHEQGHYAIRDLLKKS
jgi:hypothetical protein